MSTIACSHKLPMFSMAGALSLLLALGLGGCATSQGSAPQPAASQKPLFTSHRCAPQGPCTCRSGDDKEITPPTPPKRRFEVRLQGDSPTALTITPAGQKDQVLYSIQTGRSQGSFCVYIDLPPGEYHVEMRTKETLKGQGFASDVELNEYSHRGPYWYRLIKHRCGDPQGQSCSKTSLQGWRDELLMDRKRFQDPCASAQVKNIRWDGVSLGHLYSDLFLELDLIVAPQLPQSPPCGGS